MQSVKPTFETIILFKKIPYWLYWPAIGFLSFIFGEIMIWAFADYNFIWTLLLFSGAIGTLPFVNIWFFYSFKKIMLKLTIFLWDNNVEFNIWLKNKETLIFTLSSWKAKFVTGFILVAGLITVILLGLPLKSGICNIMGLIFFAIVLIFCGNTLYISIGLLSTLREIVKRPNRIPFFMLQHPAISRLQNYYLIQTVLIVFYYLGLVIAVWQGPYGLNYAMLIWMTGLASYPLVMFFWSFLQIHYLMQNIKQTHLETINSEVQFALKKVSSHNFKDINHLEKIMNVQDKIHAMPEWPISIGGILTFLITLATAIIQIVISVYFRG